MAISRRNALKIGVGASALAATTALTGCQTTAGASAAPAAASKPKMLGHHQIIVVGGGFGGLTVAKNLKAIDPKFDVLVIEKNETFMSCPFSNANLGKLEGINLGTFVFDYAKTVEKNGFGLLHSEVIAIDRKAKIVTTAKGMIGYDILVLSPGIEYNYKAQFPAWDDKKIAHIRRVAPGALIPGAEHVILERELMSMEEGNVIITIPSGKFRCPPAPFERASMIAAYMKKEGIAGKVIMLNETNEIAKGAAFKESWKELYGDMVEHIDFCKLVDVDPKAKKITFKQTTYKDKEDVEGTVTEKTLDYAVLNLIAYNKSHPVIEMAGLEVTPDAFGKVKMNGCSFRSLTDENIYAVGDVVGHGIPPSGQTANWAGKECAKEIAHRLHGKAFEMEVQTQTIKAGNVCFSMVGDQPEEAIMVLHDFSFNGKIITAKGSVPKDAKTGKFRGTATAKQTHEWYRGITSDLFS
ncbi:MAG: hypothetical protein KU37_09625 [Sulfuricurvum sp. PC08-66]|nr:MAG: hypothetical protein KU37_09625 [Sulfuricurvum sp. PC08-66]